ncbi:MAG TPA: hypothetical protein EYO33_13890 [Phycisphaerales bacterium]|nr:hypothetical protein [Phycisphaerales bacterium]
MDFAFQVFLLLSQRARECLCPGEQGLSTRNDSALRSGPRLLETLKIARGDGTYLKTLEKLMKYDLLILDDWGL